MAEGDAGPRSRPHGGRGDPGAPRGGPADRSPRSRRAWRAPGATSASPSRAPAAPTRRSRPWSGRAEPSTRFRRPSRPRRRYQRELAITHQHDRPCPRGRTRPGARRTRATPAPSRSRRIWSGGSPATSRSGASSPTCTSAWARFCEWSGDEARGARLLFARRARAREASSPPIRTTPTRGCSSPRRTTASATASRRRAATRPKLERISSARSVSSTAVAKEDPANVRAEVGLARLYESFGTLEQATCRRGRGAAEARAVVLRSREAYLALRARGLARRSDERRARGGVEEDRGAPARLTREECSAAEGRRRPEGILNLLTAG